MKALSKQTRSIKPAEVEKNWHIIDADGLVVGRLAAIAEVAKEPRDLLFARFPVEERAEHLLGFSFAKVRLGSG